MERIQERGYHKGNQSPKPQPTGMVDLRSGALYVTWTRNLMSWAHVTRECAQAIEPARRKLCPKAYALLA